MAPGDSAAGHQIHNGRVAVRQRRGAAVADCAPDGTRRCVVTLTGGGREDTDDSEERLVRRGAARALRDNGLAQVIAQLLPKDAQNAKVRSLERRREPGDDLGRDCDQGRRTDGLRAEETSPD